MDKNIIIYCSLINYIFLYKFIIRLFIKYTSFCIFILFYYLLLFLLLILWLFSSCMMFSSTTKHFTKEAFIFFRYLFLFFYISFSFKWSFNSFTILLWCINPSVEFAWIKCHAICWQYLCWMDWLIIIITTASWNLFWGWHLDYEWGVIIFWLF